MNSKLRRITILLLFFSFFFSTFTQAHSPDQSYLYMRIYQDAIGGRFEMTAKDMNKALNLGLADDLSMESIEPFIAQIQAYFIERSSFEADKKYTVRFTETTVLDLEEMEDFVRFHFELDGVDVVPKALNIRFNPLFDKDENHRGMLIVEHNWKAGIVDNEALITNIYKPSEPVQSLNLEDASLWKGFVALVKLGIWHIWIGLDHILFIIALILPSVVRRRKEGDVTAALAGSSWIPAENFKSAFWYIIKIITFFTIAHSITLALASLNIINLPSRFVESIIAISIALAAFHNIVPIFKRQEWIIAFGFGLFHGFGFASVLGEKGLSGDFMVLSLLGFNVGVEIGQVLIICMVFPFLFLIRKMDIYPKIIKYGSILLILISFYWFIERGFDVDLPAGAYFWKIKAAIFG